MLLEFKSVSLSYTSKILFENFNAKINANEKIIIVGNNGSGKTSLINLILGNLKPTSGEVLIPSQVITISQVAQSEKVNNLSGGESFQTLLTKALAVHPKLLILDEPTNHLDAKNKKNLLRFLSSYPGSLIIISHDHDLLNSLTFDCLWHIYNQEISIFYGTYNEFINANRLKWQKLSAEKNKLKQEKNQIHQTKMQEQERAASSRRQGEKNILNHKWPTIKSKTKAARSNATHVNQLRKINTKTGKLNQQLATLFIPKQLQPKFNLNANFKNKFYLSVNLAQLSLDKFSLEITQFKISNGDKILLTGANGTGKSLFLKALITGDNLQGEINLIKKTEIAHLDQHYANLEAGLSPLELMYQLDPSLTQAEIYEYLNSFLLAKEANTLSQNLSGGEKVCLSLALIALKMPKLLILDEPTNNLDLETKAYLLDILRVYPGSFILVCHEERWAQELEFTKRYTICANQLIEEL